MYISETQAVELVPTDPWDFVTLTGSGPFLGTVTHVDPTDHETIIIHLKKPMLYEDKQAYFIQASTRHVGDKFNCDGKCTVFCDMVSLTDEEGRRGLLPAVSALGNRLQFIGDISWSTKM